MSRPFIILGLLLCLPALAEPQGDSGPPADILAVRNIEITFHTAGSVLPNKDLDLMMSLYADDAVLTDTAHDNKVYRGKEQVRTYWVDVSGPFRPEHQQSKNDERSAHVDSPRGRWKRLYRLSLVTYRWVVGCRKAALVNGSTGSAFTILDRHQPSDRFQHAHTAVGGHEPPLEPTL
jgi:hypothetical protein